MSATSEQRGRTGPRRARPGPSQAQTAFTIIEVLAAITVLAVAFLGGTGAISQLLVIENQNQQRTTAGAAAMLLADWHLGRATAVAPAHPDLLATLTTTGAPLMTEITDPSPAWGNLRFREGEVVVGGPGPDRMFVFAAASITDPLSGAVLDLTKYQALMATISAPSAPEGDSLLSFRQVSFWYLPASRRARVIGTGPDAATTVNPETAIFLGRYLLPDAYHAF